MLRMSENNISQKDNSKSFEDNNLLADFKFWINRIRFDTPLKYTFFGLILVAQLINIYIIGWESYIASAFYLRDLLVVGLFIYSIFISKKIPSLFKESLFREILKDDCYEGYVKSVKKTFKSKSEFFLPLLGIISIIAFLYMLISGTFRYTFERRIWTDRYLEGYMYILNVICFLLTSIVYMILFILFISAFIMLLSAYKCINKLGTKDYPLNVRYKNLKSGAFETIGIFIISLTIPTILLSTLLGILGLFYIFTFGDAAIGYLYVGAGFGLTSIFCILLYINTLHLHQSIVDEKRRLLMKIMADIQKLLDEEKVDYNQIQVVHAFYEKVKEINDWPFNPASIKKLAITFSSSVVPLILSFFGFV